MPQHAEEEIVEDFPGLAADPKFFQASPQTSEYNCIAFALGETSRWYWPNPSPDSYWPPGLPFDSSLDAFVQLFESRGYTTCESGEHVVGVERVVLYTKQDRVTHAARQDPTTGVWLSKLGAWFDIVHGDPEGVLSDEYGAITQFLERQLGASADAS